MSMWCLQCNYRSEGPPWDPWLFRRVLSHFLTGILPRALWRPNYMHTAPAWRNQIYYWSLWLNSSARKWCRGKIRLHVEYAVRCLFHFPTNAQQQVHFGSFIFTLSGHRRIMNEKESAHVFVLLALANKVALHFDSDRAAALLLRQETTH